MTAAAIAAAGFAAFASAAAAAGTKTQNDIIELSDLTRVENSDRSASISSITKRNEYDNSSPYSYSSVFGSDYLETIRQCATYTTGNDYYTLTITEAGYYNFNVLSGNSSRSTIFQAENQTDGSSVSLTTNSYTQVGTYGNNETIYALKTNGAYFTGGNYKVTLSRVSDYYCNFIAAGMHKMDYGTATTGSNNVTLNFGNNSIVNSGGGSIITDSAYIRPDNLKTNSSNIAVLALPDVNISAFNKVEVSMASDASVNYSIKVGGETVAEFSNKNNNSWTNYSSEHTDLIKNNLNGLVTLEISRVDNTSNYCGNYRYVRFYYEAPTADCSYKIAVPTVNTYSGDPATGIEAAFTVSEGSPAVRSITWTATSNDNKNVSAAYKGAALGAGTYTFGLVVPKAISGKEGDTVTGVIGCTFE